MTKYILPLLALGLLAACSADDDATVATDLRPVTITATIDAQMTSRATATDDDDATRCFVQVLDASGQPITTGRHPYPLELTPQSDGSFTTDNVYLDYNASYKLVFWADGGKDFYTVSTTSLADIAIAQGKTAAGIAYRGSTGWSPDSASNTINCRLTHAVAKVTLTSTTAVGASVPVAISGIQEYSQYDAIEGKVKGNIATALTHEAQGTGAAGEVTSFYALVDDRTQDITIAVDNRQNTQSVNSVPLRTNSHVTISGDVAHVGMTNVAFTTTVNPAWANEVISTADYDYDPTSNTYTVKTADGLFIWADAARNDLTTNCTLANDIDITGRPWTTIEGYYIEEREYKGTFDGANHTIKGLSIDVNLYYCALFYGLKNATVKDVTFADVNINSSYEAATITSGCYNSLISNCHVTGKVVATSGDAAGLIRSVYNNSIVSGCSFKGEVSGRENVGGIAYYLAENSTIEDCRVEADLSSTYDYAGGIVCILNCRDENDTTKIIGCSFKGNVKSKRRYAGGIVGYSYESGKSVPSIIACHSSGTVSGEYYHGGIVGLGLCSISSCYTTADISGTGTTGAIAGRLNSTGIATPSIDNCFYSSAVGDSNAGAKEVDGNTIDWQDAMGNMNAALTNAGYQWQYVAHPADSTEEPLLLLKN